MFNSEPSPSAATVDELGTRSGAAGVARHPPGAYLLVFTEFLERFSYYGMQSLLVLFLSAAPAAGGFGWTGSQAVAFFGVFTSLIWLAPLAGGWLADVWLGPRRAVFAGGLLMGLGHLALVLATLAPELAAQFGGASSRDFIAHAAQPFGMIFTPGQLAAVRSSLAAAGVADPAGAADAFLLATAGLMGGSALIVAGNGLLKPNITVMLGGLYPAEDRRREEAFTLFYVAISAGALLAAIIAGSAGELVGWRYGFAICGIVMLCGIGLYAVLAGPILKTVGLRQARPKVQADTAVGRPRVWPGIVFLIILSAFATVFWTGYQQSGGLLTLFASRSMDRNVLGFTVPASWIASFAAAFTIVLGFPVNGLLGVLDRKGVRMDPTRRFAIGLWLGALAFVLFGMAAFGAEAAHRPLSVAWFGVYFLFLIAGELSLSPAGFAMVTRYAPQALSGRMMGVWLLSVALGSFISGQIGAEALKHPIHQVLFGLAAAFFATGAALLILRGRLVRLVA